ncbi:MAG TPA: mycothiol system anti-sigma-R factor [Candidatus Dormibacteraeota bacterium]|jgi:mycothiol system anti-sigma-R factor
MGRSNCDETMSRLSLYLDRELSDDEVGEVKVHLHACPPCVEVFDFQAELKRLVRKECCTDDAPARLRAWVRKLAVENTDPAR